MSATQPVGAAPCTGTPTQRQQPLAGTIAPLCLWPEHHLENAASHGTQSTTFGFRLAAQQRSQRLMAGAALNVASITAASPGPDPQPPTQARKQTDQEQASPPTLQGVKELRAGRFVVKGRLARQRFSEFWRATDQRTREDVVLKVRAAVRQGVGRAGGWECSC